MVKHKLLELVLTISLLVLGLLWALVQLPEGFACYKPNLLLLAVFFTMTFMPGKINIWFAWLIGLLLDSLHGFVLGSYALQFTFAALVVHVLRPKISSYSLFQLGITLAGISVVMAGINAVLYQVVYQQINHCDFYAVIPTLVLWPIFYLLAGSVHKSLYLR